MLGAVYYYTQSSDESSYELQQKITSSKQDLSEYFGGPDRIAVDGRIMCVGTNMKFGGRVYVFQLLGGVWTELAVIAGPADSIFFGFKVYLSGNKLLVSSRLNAYHYKLDIPTYPNT